MPSWSVIWLRRTRLRPGSVDRSSERSHDAVGQVDAVCAVGVAPGGVHDLVLVPLDGEAASALDAVDGGADAATGHWRHPPEAA
jgi:hypothetical protein